MCRKTRILSDCRDTTFIRVTWATLMQTSNTFFALILTFSLTEQQLWNEILSKWGEWKMFIPGTYIEPEKLYLTSWTLSISRIWNNKNSSKLSSIRPWINLCLGIRVKRYKDNKLTRETIPAICVTFFKTCGRNNFPLQIWSSSLRWILFLFFWRTGFTEQNSIEKLVSWHRENNKEYTG